MENRQKRATAAILLIISFIIYSSASIAQSGCFIVKDSVISGPQTTSYRTYQYDGGQISKVEYIDSGQTSFNQFDTLWYDVNNYLNKVENYQTGGSVPVFHKRFTMIRNSNGRITRCEASGASPSWFLAHNLTYNTNGDIASALIDQSSISGSPNGFAGELINIGWNNGNVTTVDLILDPDTIELDVISDAKNNLQSLIYPSDMTELLFENFKNNMLNVVFKNNETLGPAGTKGLDRTYNYNSFDDVEEFIELPAVFLTENQSLKYFYDCAHIGIDEKESVVSISLYPNPANDVIHLSGLGSTGSICLTSMDGKLLKRIPVDRSALSINIQDLPKNMYLLNIKGQNFNVSLPFVKE